MVSVFVEVDLDWKWFVFFGVEEVLCMCWIGVLEGLLELEDDFFELVYVDVFDCGFFCFWQRGIKGYGVCFEDFQWYGQKDVGVVKCVLGGGDFDGVFVIVDEFDFVF